MGDQGSYRELLYQYEILRARLKIRDHYLKTAVKEVYDNVGQVLSFIRVQLSSLRIDAVANKEGTIDTSGELVGKTIRDLRDICQLLYPEADIVSTSGFNRAVEQEVKILFPRSVFQTIGENRGFDTINNEKGLILFVILLEICMLIGSEGKGELRSATLKYTRHKADITIDYYGKLISKANFLDQTQSFDLSIFERAELIGGKLQIKNAGDGLRRIKLVIPTN